MQYCRIHLNVETMHSLGIQYFYAYSVAIGLSLYIISPLSGYSNPAMSFKIVVFHNLGPNSV